MGELNNYKLYTSTHLRWLSPFGTCLDGFASSFVQVKSLTWLEASFLLNKILRRNRGSVFLVS